MDLGGMEWSGMEWNEVCRQAIGRPSASAEFRAELLSKSGATPRVFHVKK